jgi:hypothetical protein
VSLRQLWAFLAVALPVLAAVIAPLPSVDLAYHLRAGAEILATRAIPTVDTWTFTAAGMPWQDQQWGAQVILAASYQTLGWTGLILVRATLVGVAFGLLFDLCRRRAGSVRIASLLTLAAFGCAAITLGLRPQLFGVALFSATLWLVLRRREEPRLVWIVVPLEIAWVNMHGSFILGPALLAIGLVEDLVDRDRGWRMSAAALVGTLLATVVNPFGLAAWGYAAGITTNSVITSRITEWQPTSIRTPEGALFFLSAGLVAIAAVWAAASGRRVRWTMLLWLGPFLLLGAWAVRGLAWWPFVATATVAPLFALAGADARAPAPERADPPLMRRLNAAIAVVIVLVAIVALPVFRPQDSKLGAPAGVVGAAPPGLTAALRDRIKPGDRLLAPQPWGSWFEFALPDAQVAVDSRIELIPAAAWDGVDRIAEGGSGWDQTLRNWGVTLVVAAPDQTDLVTRLEAIGWTVAYRDEDGFLLSRG